MLLDSKVRGAKPCPFCGSVSLRLTRTEDGDNAICCNQCTASVVGYHTKTDVLKVWNLRTPTQETANATD